MTEENNQPQGDLSLLANGDELRQIEEIVGQAVPDAEEPVETEKGFYFITPDELKRRIDEGEMENTIMLDGRGKALFSTSHIPGAINYSFANNGPEQFVIDWPDPDKTYVFICHNGTMSDKVALYLAVKHNYDKIYVLKGGYMLWSGNCYGEEYNEQPNRPDWTRKRFWKEKLGIGKK